MDICACADEEEHDQEESLELEDAEHCGGDVVVCLAVGVPLYVLLYVRLIVAGCL